MPSVGAPRQRVAILLNSLVPYGAETFVLNHASHADLSEFELLICHLGGATVLTPKFRDLGIEVVDLGHPKSPATLVRLVHLLRARRIGVLQTHVAWAGVLGRLAGSIARVPVVTTEQSIHCDPDYPRWLRFAMDRTHRLAHERVFISEAVRCSFAAAFPEDIAGPVISNGINCGAIARAAREARPSARAELGLGPCDVAFCNVARLQDRKGQRYAIEALALVRRRFRNASLWLVGAGPDEKTLRRLAAGRDVESAVHFLGQRLDVPRLLGAFDIYLHPALVEGLGIAVLEAMAASLPAIATRVGGLPEFVLDGDTGWLTEPANVNSLATAMLHALDDPIEARRRAEAGSAFVAAHHDIEASTAAYEGLYRRLAARPGPRP